ncbi:hypothetical protein T09_15694 [Trichinella sp. T9]|nr:hypothetical protein T09_15694 [Trichinella sp. T9]
MKCKTNQIASGVPLMGLTSPDPRKQQRMHVADINTAPPFETGLPLVRVPSCLQTGRAMRSG